MVSLRRALASVALVSSFLYLLSSMPLLYYGLGLVEGPCKGLPTIDLYGLTLFVGDLHVSAAPSDFGRFRALSDFVKARSVSNVVVLGDLFGWRSDYDSLVAQWGRGEEAIKWVLDALGLLGQRLTAYLILGDPSHDPKDLNLDVKFDQTRIVSVGKCAIFRVHGLTIIGVHGDQAFGGPFGFAISIVTRNLLLERLWKERMSISSDTWVIMAHTHVPGIDYAAKVANTGGWTETPLIRAPTRMGIVVDEQRGINLIAF